MFNNCYKYFVKRYIVVKYQNKKGLTITFDQMVSRIIDHQNKIPDYLRFGIKCVSLLFLLKNLFLQKKIEIGITKARSSSFLLFKNLIRFHDSIFEVANINENRIQSTNKSNLIPSNLKFDFIIIGSGPGGAVSARKLQESGFSTCILESGRIYSNDEISPFSYNEMLNYYKYSGVSTTLGNANITYVEGASVGGGSEINSGLYHRTPEHILNHWGKEYALIDSNSISLDKYFKTIEQNLCVSYFPDGQFSKASSILDKGAKELGWEVQEVPRWFKYDDKRTGSGVKMTMTKTYLKEYFNNGGAVYQLTKVQSINKQNGKWNINIGEKNFSAKNVILSAGTIGTAQILRKSRISKKAGKTFQMHPTIKVVALFDDEINEEGMGVPVHQVKEFYPKYSFGCSISSKRYLKVAMLDHPGKISIVEEKWKNMAIYYSMITPEGTGAIKNLPFFTDPLLTYNLTDRDKYNLAQGLKKLCKLLIFAGANTLYPSIKEGPVITNINDINQLPESIDTINTSLMTVHLFSSCPIGERKDRCVADSFGNVLGQEGLFISDGSMLPSAPGVNPQGTIMAFAHRNIEKIISEL
jgi:hypothetical protein